jgi:2C-methyl-D-erythritol 2,4-cyclodiphosphate synthase
MKLCIAEALKINIQRVGIKATTNELMGFIGREEGIAAMAVASVDLPES